MQLYYYIHFKDELLKSAIIKVKSVNQMYIAGNFWVFVMEDHNITLPQEDIDCIDIVELFDTW